MQFNPQSDYWLDVETFDQQISQTARPEGWALTPESVASLREAIALYRGDFLEGFHVRDAPGFEEWVLGEQERLRQLALQALHILAVYHTGRGECVAGVDYVTRLLALDPWREKAHRQLMLLLARSGQRSAGAVRDLPAGAGGGVGGGTCTGDNGAVRANPRGPCLLYTSDAADEN